MKNTKGFTLVEILIVVAIVGILAVAFLPSLIGAPTKARDTQRKADIQSLQKIIISENLAGVPYPNPAGGEVCIGADTSFDKYLEKLGGKVLTDPISTTAFSWGCAGQYFYVKNPNNGGTVPSGTYEFALIAHMELFDFANTDCTSARSGEISIADPDDDTTWCYAILIN